MSADQINIALVSNEPGLKLLNESPDVDSFDKNDRVTWI